MNSFKTSFLALAAGLTLTTTTLLAQSRVEVFGSNDGVVYERGSGSGSNDKLSSAKIGFITSELDLTPKQAESFWPLFNEFDTKRKAIRSQMKTMRLDDDSMNDKESLDKARNFLSLRESEVKLERDYFDKFSKVLSGKQVLTIMSMDREFARMLLKKTKDKFGPGYGGYNYSYSYSTPSPAIAPLAPVAPLPPSAASVDQLNRELEQLHRQEKQLKKRIDKERSRSDRQREREDRTRDRNDD